MRNYLFYTWLALLIAVNGYAQPNRSKIQRRVSEIFMENKQKPQILLLGVFHFAGEKIDTNTTQAELKVDMLSADRQKQIKGLVDRLAKFNPTKIVIEASPRSEFYYDSLYIAYRKGKVMIGKDIDPSSEEFQLAFRLANILKLKKLYPADAQPFRFRLSKADSVLTYEKYKDQSDSSFIYWDKPYIEQKKYEDSLAFSLPLIKYLRYLNSPEKQARSIGRWLITTKRGTNLEPIGADGFITRYFNRNVRIYANIQRIVENQEDRILIIYGATHMYMLKHLFAASPEFDLKDIMEYLK